MSDAAALTRFGATLLQVLSPPRLTVANGDPGNQARLGKEAAGRFGSGIRLHADPHDPRCTDIVVDFDRLPTLQGRNVVIAVLRDDDNEPLTHLTFMAAAGRHRQSVQMDSALIQQRRLRVAIGVMGGTE